jgi:hypothetical protein
MTIPTHEYVRHFKVNSWTYPRQSEFVLDTGNPCAFVRCARKSLLDFVEVYLPQVLLVALLDLARLTHPSGTNAS